jgi:hypothetical protein
LATSRKSHRVIGRLLYAKFVERPKHIPESRGRTAAQKEGRRFEKKVLEKLKELLPGAKIEYHQWIEYADENGVGYCEPEAFVEFEHKVLLVECKRTGIEGGKLQMVQLYAPLLALLIGKPIQMVQICRHVNKATPGPLEDDFLQVLAGNQPYATIQWLL